MSFRSLLRAYLAAASMGTEVPQVLLLEPDAGRLQIIGAARTVKLEFTAATGEGYWAIHGSMPAMGESAGEGLLDEGAFRLHLDAEFDWSGKAGRLPMDQVAEALAMLALE